MTTGFEIRDETGAVTFSNRKSGLRLVDVRSYAWNFSGTDVVPGFDDTLGIFTYVPYTDGTVWAFPMPSLFWDNQAQTLTVTAAQAVYEVPRPGRSPIIFGRAVDFEVRFYHYR